VQPKTGRPFWPTLALACAMSICVCSCGSQTAQKRPIQVSDSTAVLEVDDPRPLMAAAEAIEEEYGIQINYEDPRSGSPAMRVMSRSRSHGAPAKEECWCPVADRYISVSG